MNDQKTKPLETPTLSKTPKKTTGWFVVRWMAGLFGAMFLANGFFVYFALNSHSGEQSSTAYEDGLNYNNTIEDRRKLKALGWTMTVKVEQGTTGNVLVLTFLDKNQVPLKGLTLKATMFNPVNSGEDPVLSLTRLDDGYRAPLNLPRKGQWDLQVKITLGENSGVFTERLNIK